MPAAREPEAELTLRGMVLGAAITVVFMSANVYLGLKTGVTFSSSIPAAVISMGLLKLFGGGGVLENNIVQTQASASGTLCNVNLVLPGLLLIDYWRDFPLWQTTALCLLGGLFGVAFSVPLRRVMVVEGDLPFPEGVAAAEVLLSGHDGGQGGEGGLRRLGLGAVAAGIFGLVTAGLKVLPEQIGASFVAAGSVIRLDCGLSLALVGIGYLVRLGCCLALLIGILIAWGIAVPILTSGTASDDPRALAELVWSGRVRLIGAGLIAVAGLWTVATLIKPMIGAIRTGIRGSAAELASVPSTARDIPMAWVGIAIAVLLVPLAALLWSFAAASGTTVPLPVLVPVLTLGTALFGFLMATACGYLAGLLGSSSSPISGIGILTIMLVAGCGLAVLPSAPGADARFVGALTLFVTALIVTASSIANDNLQDLKAGQLVGATPWKQQAALAIGVVLGAATIAPVLQLLFNAYGFSGMLPRPGMDPRNALPAPQAALLAQIADGIVRHRLDWTMVSIGAVLGAVFVALEAVLRRRRFSLPALSVGIGMYLPCAVVLTIAVGGVVGWLAERAAASGGEEACDDLRRRGVLLSSGFLVGESLVGIMVAFSDIFRGRSNSLALHLDVAPAWSAVAAVLVFAGLLAWFYRATSRIAR